MHQTQAGQRADGHARPGSAFNWFIFAVRSLAFSVEAVLHRRMGSQFAGLQGPGAIAAIILFAAFWPGHDLRWLLGFLGLFLVSALIGRIGTLFHRGRRAHSRYSGRPLLLYLLPHRWEAAVKRMLEPLVVLLAGVAIHGFNQPLGFYLMFAAAGLALSVNLDADYDRARALALYDASLEHEQVAERFRELRGEDFD